MDVVVAELPCEDCDGTGWNVRLRLGGDEHVLQCCAQRFRDTLLSWRDPNHPSQLGADFQRRLFKAASQVAKADLKPPTEAIYMADQLGRFLHRAVMTNAFDETTCRTCQGRKCSLRIVDTGQRLPFDEDTPSEDPEGALTLFLLFPGPDVVDPMEWALEASDVYEFGYESELRIDGEGRPHILAWPLDRSDPKASRHLSIRLDEAGLEYQTFQAQERAS